MLTRRCQDLQHLRVTSSIWSQSAIVNIAIRGIILARKKRPGPEDVGGELDFLLQLFLGYIQIYEKINYDK
jgi:hypothetical protein